MNASATARSAPNALVLFDIDGTLIRRAGPHHREALVDAIRRVTGVDTTLDGVDTAGMLDRDLIPIMMAAAGVSRTAISRELPAIIETAQRLYVRRCPDLRQKVCPGVNLLISRLSRRAVPLGLVTGNFSRIGWRKVKQAGLGDRFRVGAFAEMASTRAGLVRVAIRQARAASLIDRGSRISLIGDHPNDVEAAKLNGIQSVAVGTGVCGRDALIACGPDILVDDMRSLRLEMLC